MKKYLALILALLLTTAMLTGCGGSSGEPMAMDSAQSNEMAAVEDAGLYGYSASGSENGSAVTSDTLSEQKLIKTVSIDAETEDLETLLRSLTQQVAGLGGYIENQEIYNGSAYASHRYRSASLTIRIPAEKLDGFVSEVRGLSNVVNYNESAKDVTLTYVATESRVAALEAEEKRLLELMDQAETMSDLLEIEARLTEVRSELESTTSQLRVLANQVSYATVNLYLEQVEVYTEMEEPTVWERITSGFSGNLKDIGEGLVDFFVWAVTYSPQLIFWAAVIAAAVVIAKRTTQKRREKKAPKQDGEEK